MTAAPLAPSAAETPRVRTRLRRSVFWVVVVVAAVVFAVFTMLLTASGTPDGERYSLGNAGAEGSRAVAEVLRQQGVEVIAASSLDEARSAVAGGAATVLFTDPYGYLDDTGLAAVAGLGRSLVLVEPGSQELDVLAPGIEPAGAAEDAEEVAAACTLPAAERAGTVSRPTTTYRAVDDTTVEDSCFPSYDDAYGLVRLDTGPSTVTVLGTGDALTNGTITQAGNAALALGLLGENPTLVWYVPGPDDLAEGPSDTLGSLTPGWVTPVMLLGALVVVAAGVWRGRRFGPVVVENMPVTVRASETMEGRARLYARQGAHTRALDSLRIGTLARLSERLALPRQTDVVEVSRAVAAVTGRHVDEVHRILVGELPRSESELVAASDRLLLLEQEVARATLP
ncbi:DUF4350 domain-containing protein [Herbiconiux moechotypicola]|uniref:DUF4350 domain-containing protein n=1 Tax=Herbiconiux moechotypicola TaxID=637393 RepID=A0ABN3DUK4_9MICO|nr:DUF4350 domain-containing protein [Herbiconiux moechotypicola]MCS5731044.1 DUF4350 domain-containing protein [Herbiconiux moechotypicola]